MGEKTKNTAKFLLENVLNVVSDYGKEAGKEVISELELDTITEAGAGFAIDLGGSMVPLVGKAFATYRTNKKIANLNRFLQELAKKQEELQCNFAKQNEENKNTLDTIFNMVVDKVSGMHQQEKIKYMVDGYSYLLETENPSFDTAYLYFDTLDRLTLLDIAVLKLFYNTNTIDQENERNYKDILEEFDIDYDQYKGVRENLFRIGLLENEYDNKVEKDMENIVRAIDELREVTEGLSNTVASKKRAKLKKLTKNSDIKLKAKDRLKISGFGRKLVKYFIER